MYKVPSLNIWPNSFTIISVSSAFSKSHHFCFFGSADSSLFSDMLWPCALLKWAQNVSIGSASLGMFKEGGTSISADIPTGDWETTSKTTSNKKNRNEFNATGVEKRVARSSWWSFIKEVGLKLDVKLGEGRAGDTKGVWLHLCLEFGVGWGWCTDCHSLSHSPRLSLTPTSSKLPDHSKGKLSLFFLKLSQSTLVFLL